MFPACSVGDTSGTSAAQQRGPDDQATRGAKILLQENMGTSLLEHFSVDTIQQHIRILSEQKKSSASNFKKDLQAVKDSCCNVCNQGGLLFEAPYMQCYKCNDTIKRNQFYYAAPRGSDVRYARASWCTACVNSSGGIRLESLHLQKKNMKKERNDPISGEAWVQCDECKRWVHQICGLFNKGRSVRSRGFLCPRCLLTGLETEKRRVPENRSQSMLRARDLPRCRLSDVIEERLDAAIKNERDGRANAMNVDPSTLETVSGLTVRIVSNAEKQNEVKPMFAKEFCQNGRVDTYTYKQKVILLFQEVDGVDLFLFCMYIQEYGDDCPTPNNRTGISHYYSGYLPSHYSFCQFTAILTGSLKHYLFLQYTYPIWTLSIILCQIT